VLQISSQVLTDIIRESFDHTPGIALENYVGRGRFVHEDNVTENGRAVYKNLYIGDVIPNRVEDPVRNLLL